MHVSCPSNHTKFRGVGWALHVSKGRVLQSTFMEDARISKAQMIELFLELNSTCFFLSNLLIKICMAFPAKFTDKTPVQKSIKCIHHYKTYSKIDQTLPDGVFVTHSFNCWFLSSPNCPHLVKLRYKSNDHNFILFNCWFPSSPAAHTVSNSATKVITKL